MKNGGYKGFEAWCSRMLMTVKMHVIIILALVVAGVMMLLIHNFYYFQDHWGQVYVQVMGAFIGADHEAIQEGVRKAVGIVFLSWPVAMKIFAVCVWGYLLILIYFFLQTKQMQSEKYLRGARFVPVLKVQLRQLFLRGSIPIGRIKLPPRDETTHVFIVGRTRSGKSQILKRVVGTLKSGGKRQIIYDNKGDYVPSFYESDTDLIYCPADERSIGWSIFNDVRTVMDIDQIVCWTLIPEEKGKDPFWNKAARDVLRGVLFYLWYNRDGDVTNLQIWEMLTSGSDNIISALKTIHEGKIGIDALGDAGSKQCQGVLGTLLSYVKSLEYVAKQDGDFSVRQWMRQDDPGSLFLVNTAATADIFKPLQTLMLEFASMELLSMPDDMRRRRYVVLDEFGSLHPMQSIVELLARAGSKGASVWIGTQDIGQIDSAYGDSLRKTIVNNCGTKVLLSVSEPDTMAYLSELIGCVEVVESSETNSMGVNSFRDGVSISRQLTVKELVIPSEFARMPNLRAILKLPGMDYLKIRIPVFRDVPLHAPFVLSEALNLKSLAKRFLKSGANKVEPEKTKTPEVSEENEIDLD